VAFGEQHPYVSCELLPNSDGERVRTAAVLEGGTDPSWDELLVLHAKQGATKLRIGLYDEGTVIDTLIGEVELELEDVCTDHPLPMKFLLDTGGKIEVTVHQELPEQLERDSELAPVVRALYQDHPHAVSFSRCNCQTVFCCSFLTHALLLHSLSLKMLAIEIVRAEGIRDISTFGSMDPYCQIRCLQPSTSCRSVGAVGGDDEHDKSSLGNAQEYSPLDEVCPDCGGQARTSTVSSGNTDPCWAGTKRADRILVVTPDGRANRILLQVWNENLAIDDLIGQVELELGQVAEQGVRRQSDCSTIELELDTGGTVQITAAFVEPVSCDSQSGNVFVGCKCVPGLHLEQDDLYKPLAGNVVVADELCGRVQGEREKRSAVQRKMKGIKDGTHAKGATQDTGTDTANGKGGAATAGDGGAMPLCVDGFDERGLVIGTVIGFRGSNGECKGKYPTGEMKNGVMVQWQFKNEDGEVAGDSKSAALQNGHKNGVAAGGSVEQNGEEARGDKATEKLLHAMMRLGLRPMDVFKALDLNHDKRISKKELKAGLHKLGCKDVDNEDIGHMVAEYDEDGDGNLDVKEWRGALDKKYRERRHSNGGGSKGAKDSTGRHGKEEVLQWRTLLVAGSESRSEDETTACVGMRLYELGMVTGDECSEGSRQRKERQQEAVAKANELARLKGAYGKSKAKVGALIREQAMTRKQLHSTGEEMKRVEASGDNPAGDMGAEGEEVEELGTGVKTMEELEEEKRKSEELLAMKKGEAAAAEEELKATKEEWVAAQQEQEGRTKAEGERQQRERDRLQAKEAKRQHLLLLQSVVSVQTKWRGIRARKVLGRERALRERQGTLVVCAQCAFRRWSARRRYLRIRGHIRHIQCKYRNRRMADRNNSAALIGRACLCSLARDLARMKRRVRKRFHKLWPLIRLIGSSAFARRKRGAVTAIQALFRGRVHRRLATLLTTVGCALSAEIHCADGLRDGNFMTDQDPYVVVTLIPRQRPFTLRSVRRSVIEVNGGFRDAAIEAVAKAVKKQEAGGSDACAERTECAYGGGVTPVWTKKHNNTLMVFCDAVLPTLAAMSSVRIEVRVVPCYRSRLCFFPPPFSAPFPPLNIPTSPSLSSIIARSGTKTPSSTSSLDPLRSTFRLSLSTKPSEPATPSVRRAV
jgi:hypothetical protein